MGRIFSSIMKWLWIKKSFFSSKHIFFFHILSKIFTPSWISSIPAASPPAEIWTDFRSLFFGGPAVSWLLLFPLRPREVAGTGADLSTLLLGLVNMLEVTLALVLVEVDGASLRFTFLEAQALEGLLKAVALLFWGAVVCLFCRTFFVSLTDSSSFSVRALLSESSSWSLGLLKIPESKNGSGSLAQVTLALVEVEVGHSINNSI